MEPLLASLLKSVEGLVAIAVSDFEGAPVLNVSTSSATMDPVVFASASVVCEQASRIGLGTSKSIATATDNLNIVHFNMEPLVVTLVGDQTSKIGALMALEESLRETFKSLRVQVQLQSSQ
eukprot:m.7782 g.7782  ORF g.7782 m.7782 type:complete len:121 (-) comp4905_c0_seq1:48-410(-)